MKRRPVEGHGTEVAAKTRPQCKERAVVRMIVVVFEGRAFPCVVVGSGFVGVYHPADDAAAGDGVEQST
jgi:hypothetical protein